MLKNRNLSIQNFLQQEFKSLHALPRPNSGPTYSRVHRSLVAKTLILTKFTILIKFLTFDPNYKPSPIFQIKCKILDVIKPNYNFFI